MIFFSFVFLIVVLLLFFKEASPRYKTLLSLLFFILLTVSVIQELVIPFVTSILSIVPASIFPLVELAGQSLFVLFVGEVLLKLCEEVEAEIFQTVIPLIVGVEIVMIWKSYWVPILHQLIELSSLT